MPYSPTNYHGMADTDRNARLAGESAGYSAANYAVNVSGEDLTELQPDCPLGLTETSRMWYEDGWARGVEQYEHDDSGDAMSVLRTPRGYTGVEHDDGTVHAIDLDGLHDGRPLWRETPVCGSATGVSSDEAGPDTLHRAAITCWECVSILA